MLEKQKEWCKEKGKKGKELIKKEKGKIYFGLGIAAMAGVHLILKKINEPKSAWITMFQSEDDHIFSTVEYKNQFGRDKQMITIDHGVVGREADSNGLKKLCDELNEIVYPGD